MTQLSLWRRCRYIPPGMICQYHKKATHTPHTIVSWPWFFYTPWCCAIYDIRQSPKYREISFAHNLFVSYTISFKFSTDHRSDIWWFQNDWTTKMDVMDERDFARFEFLRGHVHVQDMLKLAFQSMEIFSTTGHQDAFDSQLMTYNYSVNKIAINHQVKYWG